MKTGDADRKREGKGRASIYPRKTHTSPCIRLAAVELMYETEELQLHAGSPGASIVAGILGQRGREEGRGSDTRKNTRKDRGTRVAPHGESRNVVEEIDTHTSGRTRTT